MEIDARAPLYAHFLQCLAGLSTIRAFRWEPELTEKNKDLLDFSQRPIYLLYSVQIWLKLVLDLLIAAIVTLLCGLVVGLRSSTSTGFVGLAFVNIVSLYSTLR